MNLPCNFDHNGECLVCDCWPSQCAYKRYLEQDYTYETKEQLEEMFKEYKAKPSIMNNPFIETPLQPGCATESGNDLEHPYYKDLGQLRAGKLLRRLWKQGWEMTDVQIKNKKANDYIDALVATFDEIQKQIVIRANDGHLLKGLMEEQNQVLRELEVFIIKCLRHQNKENKQP